MVTLSENARAKTGVRVPLKISIEATFCFDNLKWGDDVRKIQRIPKDAIPTLSTETVRLKVSGNVVKQTEYERLPEPPPIVKLDKERYQYTADIRDADTGEIIHHCGDIENYKHIENRAQDKRSVLRSLEKLRDLINSNVTDCACMRWITLTYAENMMDVKRLYDDFRKFNMRFCYYLQKSNIETPEYIAVAEPQGRGAWHMHVLYIWPCVAPFLDNNTVFQPIWGYGFTKIKAVRGDVDNLGAYLSAYLGDMSFEEYEKLDGNDKIAALRDGAEIVEKEITDERGRKVKKRILKGARLRLYPPGMNIFRTSRGVKRPVEGYVSRESAKRKVGSAKPTFQTALEILDVSAETGKSVKRNKIVKTYYNLKSLESQDIFEEPETKMCYCSACQSLKPWADFVYLDCSIGVGTCRDCSRKL